jgi:hypothetical protein
LGIRIILHDLALLGKLPNNRIAALAQTIDTRIREEFYCLPYAEFAP